MRDDAIGECIISKITLLIKNRENSRIIILKLTMVASETKSQIHHSMRDKQAFPPIYLQIQYLISICDSIIDFLGKVEPETRNKKSSFLVRKP